MGKRDKERREAKKPKKDARKSAIETIIQPPMSVEVVRKKRKEREEEED
jgi:hypothetical protein